MIETNVAEWRMKDVEKVRELAQHMIEQMIDDPLPYRAFWLSLYRKCDDRIREVVEEIANI